MITSLLAVNSFETWQIILLAFGYAATLAAIIGVGVLLVRSGNKQSSKRKARKVVVPPTVQQARPATSATPIVVQLPQQPAAQKSVQQPNVQQPVVQTVPVMVQPQQPTVIAQMPYVQPMMQMPMAQPMAMPYYVPMQQPMMQQPVQQPVAQQPVQQQPVAQQPAPEPAPQPEVRRGMADNDRVLDVFGFYSPVDETVASSRSRETSKRRG